MRKTYKKFMLKFLIWYYVKLNGLLDKNGVRIYTVDTIIKLKHELANL